MSVESRRTFSLTIHPWCMSPSRDEAVRAAEDNRTGPLPTLEECIERVTERRPVPPGGGGNVTPAASGAAVLAEIAAAFGCDPDDNADLVEAAKLLVRERDDAVAKAASGAAGTDWLKEVGK